MLISYDPGSVKSAVALWDDKELTAAFIVLADDWEALAHRTWELIAERLPLQALRDSEFVSEKMQIYSQHLQRSPQKDLIEVSHNVGGMVMLGRVWYGIRPTLYTPAKWKRGQRPKEVQAKMTQEKLSKEERDRIELPRAKKQQLDIWDAVGIGLFHLNRDR